MKKTIFALLLMALIAAPVWAADYPLTFTWDDSNTKASGYGWKLFMRTDSGKYVYTAPVATIQHVQGQTEFKADKTITLNGQPGSQVNCYFVLRAFSGALESIDSNETTFQAMIPLAAPFSFTVTVKTQ